MAVEHTFIHKGGTKTKKLTPTTAIAEKCLECSNWSSHEVANCPCTDCALYPFRAKKFRPKRAVSEEARRKASERMSEIHAKIKNNVSIAASI